MLRIAGLAPGTSPFYKWLPYFWLIAAGIIILPCVNYVAANLSDLADSTDAAYVVAGSTQTVAKFYVFWSHIKEITQIHGALQAIINRRKYRRRHPSALTMISN